MKYIVIGILLFVTVVAFSLVFNVFWQPQMWSAPSKSHLENTINNASYFTRLNRYDLIARQSDSQEQYISIYKKAIEKFSPDEKRKLDRLIDTICTKYTNKYDKFQRIPWLLVKFKGVENDYPHTLGDVIFLSQNFFLMESRKQIETLIHEKWHVFQRTYPIETAKLINSLGFKIWGTQESVSNIRTNPDTNSFVYSLDDTVQAQLYDSETPRSVSDSHTQILEGKTPWKVASSVKQSDHPYEIMACAFAQVIVGSFASDDNILKNKFSEQLELVG